MEPVEEKKPKLYPHPDDSTKMISKKQLNRVLKKKRKEEEKAKKRA